MRVKLVRALMVWLLAVAVAISTSTHAAPLLQDSPTATPNATEAMGTAYASLATPEWSSAVKYGDLAEISMLLVVALIMAIVFMLWIVDVLLRGQQGR